jgi:hypothetical protein
MAVRVNPALGVSAPRVNLPLGISPPPCKPPARYRAETAHLKHQQIRLLAKSNLHIGDHRISYGALASA